jgi:hypothetical protein
VRTLRCFVPNPRDGTAAGGAVAALHLDLADLVALAGDDQLLAMMAEGIFGLMPGQVADIDILESRFQSQVPGPLQGAHRGGIMIQHLVEGIKPGEVQRRQGAQLIFDPGAHAAELVRGVV